MSRISIIFAFVASLVLVSSCTKGITASHTLSKLDISLDVLDEDGATKNTITLANERVVDNIRLLVYTSDGEFVSEYASYEGGSLELVLEPGDYDFHAFVNCKGLEIDYDMDKVAFVPRPHPVIESLYKVRNYIPMFGSAKGVSIVEGDPLSLTIPVKRIMARVVFRADWSNTVNATYHINSISLCQCLSSFHNVALIGGDVSIDNHYDFTASIDVDNVNNGASAYIYIPQNLCGTIVPSRLNPASIDTPAQKNKDYLSELGLSQADHATYISINTTYSNPSTGVNAKYNFRAYLGENNTYDFNVRANNTYTFVFAPTDKSINMNNWKVEGPLDDDSNIDIDIPEEGGNIIVH